MSSQVAVSPETISTFWLNGVPPNWALKPLWAVASCNDETLPENTSIDRALTYVEISDVSAGRGITGSTEVLFAQAPSRARRVVKQGDIIVSTVRTYLKAIAHISEQYAGVVVSTGFAVLRPFGLYDRFLAHVLTCEGMIAEVIARSVGVSYPAINSSDLLRIKVPVPPHGEQRAIAAFLDRETAKIDALVGEQERLLVLLEEKRQAVIANAVTKGLDPTVPMRDSGVEWLGQVPAHWSVATTNMLKAPASTITYGIVQAGPDVEGGIPYVRTSDMSGTELPLTGYLRTTPEIAAAYERSSIKAGDLVIAIRASIGKTLIVPPELAGGNLTQGTAKIEPGRNIFGKFLCYVLNSVPCQQHFASIAKGTTFKEITLEMLRKLKVPQPSRAEQQLIVEHLAAVLPSIGQLISEAETARGLLHERRAALISAAVTGKLDVRAVAPATEPALAAE